jgi:hypothetical protein
MRVPSLYVLNQVLPMDVVREIDKFFPYPKKKKESISPSMQKELQKIQTLNLRGKSNMYMKDLIDFVLD